VTGTTAGPARGPGTVAEGVWADLVGQDPTVRVLRSAVDAANTALSGGRTSGMTHAWLFTGPPGSGLFHQSLEFALVPQ
jgi:DNA polymerase III subunit delta'